MSYSDDMMIDNRNSVFHNNSVDDMLSKLVAEAKNYDVYNLIQRIACLNLFHQNQNKAVIFDAFLDALLQHKAEEFASEHPMSCGKFRKFLCGLIETSLGASIDPPENLFIQNVMFYGNYEVFNGIDYHPAYNLQMIIRTVFETSNSFPIEFKKRVSRLVNYVLRKSNHIANSLDSTENNHVEDEARSLYIPASSIIERYAALVVLQGSEVRAALENDAQLLGMIVTRFGESGESDFDNRCFYRAPLLYNPHKDEYIILNIGLLVTALFYWILCLAEKYGVQQKLLADFNECTFYHCQKYLKRLGHLKIKESQFDISLANELYYKEWIGTVHNNQLLVMLYLCDEGVGINADSMHSCVQTDKYGNTINDRMQELVSKLTKHGVQDKDIYFVFVVNGIGRSISFGIHKNSTPHALLTFAPMELMCISINEEKDSAFLPRYIDAKSSFSQSFNGMISELNAIELYTSQDYSFYLGDDIDPAEISMFFAPGDSIDYIKRALTKEDRRLVEAFEGNRYAEVVLDDQKRKIYIDTTITKEIKLSYYLNFNWFSLWVTTDPITDYRAIEIYHTFTDTIAYWLAELRPYMESVKGEENQALQICVQLSDEIDEYKYDRERVSRLNDCLKISSENNSIRLLCSADVLRYLNFDDNTHEKEFIQIMLNVLTNHLHINTQDSELINDVFRNRKKKKVYTLNYSSQPYLKPVEDRNYHYVHKEDEEQLLNWIGNKMLSEENWKLGVVNDCDRTTVANKVVSILYDRLAKEVSELSPYHLIEIIYDDLEKILYNVMLANHRFASDIACYPEKEKQILDEINKANQASMALKFLLEYIAAKPPAGAKIIAEGDYERLIAICFLIIDWAYKNDLFYYKVVNTPIEFLKSKRIGMKQLEFQKMTKINERNRRSQLEWSSSYGFRETYDVPHVSYIVQVDDALKDEQGYSLAELQLFIDGMTTYGEELPGDTVYVKPMTEVKKYLMSYSDMLSSDVIDAIFKGISLRSREDFLQPPKPFKKEDVYPWRFNREYSFTRRPIIIRSNDVIWGNRQLAHMLSYTINLIYEGKFKARKPKMIQLMGQIADSRGKEFNDSIFERIRQMNEFEVSKNISEVNKKRIATQEGNVLGDIDVLVIDRKNKTIICAEVKDFNFSRNPYEVHQEYLKMFDHQKGYYYKHQKRVHWCAEHISDFVTQYNLSDVPWKVLGTFIVSEPLGSNEIYEKEVSVITEAKLSIGALRRISCCQ